MTDPHKTKKADPDPPPTKAAKPGKPEALDHTGTQPATDGSGGGLGGKNIPGHSLSHAGHQADEDNLPSDGSGSGTGGKNIPDPEKHDPPAS